MDYNSHLANMPAEAQFKVMTGPDQFTSLSDENQLVTYKIGRLGAEVFAPYVRQGGMAAAYPAQLDMIERRILRIEAALRQAGIPLDAIPL